MASRRLTTALLAALSFAPASARADVVPVRVEGQSGPWVEEREADGSWRHVCDVPCEAPMDRVAPHRVVDGDAMHRLSIPMRGDHPAVVYVPPGAPEKLMIAGAVVGGAGVTTVVIAAVVAMGTSIGYRDPAPDVPPPTNPALAPAGAAAIAGGIGVLIGGALAISGLIARDVRASPSALASPLGFRF